jgi:hypothetical protein
VFEVERSISVPAGIDKARRFESEARAIRGREVQRLEVYMLRSELKSILNFYVMVET